MRLVSFTTVVSSHHDNARLLLFVCISSACGIAHSIIYSCLAVHPNNMRTQMQAQSTEFKQTPASKMACMNDLYERPHDLRYRLDNLWVPRWVLRGDSTCFLVENSYSSRPAGVLSQSATCCIQAILIEAKHRG